MAVLGNFYERIHGSVEFLASESLNYILNSSDKVSMNIVNMINLDTNCHYENVRFTSQVQGADKEIPDLSGYDKNRNEVIILETKFWASLTKNQPMTYLKRIHENGNLVFICPDLRKISLKSEILHVLDKEKIVYKIEDKFINVDNKKIIIYSWDSVLNTMKNDLNNSDFEVLSDINQLFGLCKRIDNESFLPIVEDDLSPSIPRKILSYYKIIDKVIDKLKLDINLSTNNVRKTAHDWGYTRYAKIESMSVELDVNMEWWSKYADTPFWIQIGDSWNNTPVISKVNAEIEKKYGKINHESQLHLPYYAIHINTGDIEEKVIETICDFVKDIYKIYKKNL